MVRGFAVAAMIGACAWVATAANAQCPTPAAVTSACAPEASCARLAVGNANGSTTQAGAVSITFAPGADDGQENRGPDDVAAIAFTVGIPGTGDGAPLVFDCANGNLAEGAVTPGAGIADAFTVVVENAQCTGRNRCLCPDSGAGQTRDNFVNIAVYGPKNLPEQGPVSIPKLPSGELVKLNLKAASGASGTVTMHVFSALDGGSRPQFTANASIGDQSACDVSAASDGKSAILFTSGTFTIGQGGPTCPGDCNGDKQVAINELIIGVNIALGAQPVSACPSFDTSGDGTVAINELIGAVNAALGGCPS